MAILPIVTVPDPRLKQLSVPVTVVDDRVRRLMDDMLETMYAAPGVGLAAVQVGVMERIVVIDVSREGEAKAPMRFVNPVVTWRSETLATCEEGCLSIPDQYAEVERPDACRVDYLDENGNPQTLSADGLLAVCIQHEIDHLDGVLFVDHLSRVKRGILLRKLAKARRSAVPA